MVIRPARILLASGFSLAVSATAYAQTNVPTEAGVSRGVGVVEAYQQLLKENLSLRSEIRSLTENADGEKKRSSQLARTVSDLEAQIVGLVKQIDAMKTDQSERTDPAEVAALRTRIAGYEQEEARLTEQVGDLKMRVAELDKPEAEAAGVPAAGPQMAPGSDLHRQLERENVLLRKQLQELQAAKASAVQTEENLRQEMMSKDSAIGDLETGRHDAAAEREALLRLGKHLRRLQGAVRDLENEVQTKESKLRQEKARTQLLEDQLASRDETIRNIKRVGELFDRIDQEQKIQSLPSIQKREHYRVTADEYHEAGQFRLAQVAYHKALAIDPSYADVHYNLGLLYDQHLGDKNRALMHYNAYVQLRPNADDAALVKLWIREAELSVPDVVEPVEMEDGLSYLLERAAEPVAGDETTVEHRDFYCDQAAAFSRQGRVDDAVTAYLRALEFDPDYADVHYNLGVLYDDYLSDKGKAVEHYRRYLELRPHAGDSDRVRLWLREADMGL